MNKGTYNKETVQKRVANGQCAMCCGRPLVTKIMCERCRNLIKKSAKRQREKRRLAGVCYDCGKIPPKEGRTKCENCSKKASENNKNNINQRKNHCKNLIQS